MRQYRVFLLSLVLATAFIVSFPVSATGLELQGDWTYRVEIVIDSDDISETLYNYPVLVVLNGDVVDWEAIQDDCDDIRFTDENYTRLAYELESYRENSVAYFWVTLPEVSASSDTSFYCVYGNLDAIDAQDPANVWSDTDFEQVHHLYDTRDSSTYGRTLEKQASDKPDDVTGFIDGAWKYDGTDYARTVNTYNLAGSGDTITFEAYANCTTQGYAQTLLGENAQWGSIGYLWCARSGTALSWEYGDGTNPASVSDADFFTGYNDDPLYIVVVANYTSENIEFFRNGVSVHTGVMVTSIYPNQVTQKYIGAFSTAGHRFNGIIDEWRLSSTNRSDAYITANYLAYTEELLLFNDPELIFAPSLVVELFFGDFALLMFLVYAVLILWMSAKFAYVGSVLAIVACVLLGFQYLDYVHIYPVNYWYFIMSMFLTVFSVILNYMKVSGRT